MEIVKIYNEFLFVFFILFCCFILHADSLYLVQNDSQSLREFIPSLFLCKWKQNFRRCNCFLARLRFRLLWSRKTSSDQLSFSEATVQIIIVIVSAHLWKLLALIIVNVEWNLRGAMSKRTGQLLMGRLSARTVCCELKQFAQTAPISGFRINCKVNWGSRELIATYKINA